MPISSNGPDSADAALRSKPNDLIARPYEQVRAPTADRQCGSERPRDRKGP